MCFPKAILKTIIAIVGLVAIAGGICVVIFGRNFAKEEIVEHFTKDFKWLVTTFIYGACGTLVVVGLLQLLACKTENRCLIFLYEAFAIFTFLVVTGTFVGFWYEKDKVMDKLDEITNANHTFTRMYNKLGENETRIFDTLCAGQYRVQDCKEDHMEIFGEVIDEDWMFVGYLLDTYVECSGMNNTLTRYYFSNFTRGTPPASCSGKVKDFINGICLCLFFSSAVFNTSHNR